jgi:hypothetical protein
MGNLVTYLNMAIVERCSTLQGVRGKFDEGIDMEQLLANASARETPTLGSMLRSPINTPRLKKCNRFARC